MPKIVSDLWVRLWYFSLQKRKNHAEYDTSFVKVKIFDKLWWMIEFNHSRDEQWTSICKFINLCELCYHIHKWNVSTLKKWRYIKKMKTCKASKKWEHAQHVKMKARKAGKTIRVHKACKKLKAHNGCKEMKVRKTRKKLKARRPRKKWRHVRHVKKWRHVRSKDTESRRHVRLMSM